VCCSHGLPEDYHFALLSDLTGLEELVSTTFIKSDEVMAMISNNARRRYNGKISGKTVAQKTLHSEAVEMVNLCPYVYEFPVVQEI
jgi:hypothetical protein